MRTFTLLLLAAGSALLGTAAEPKSDIPVSSRRKPTVELAQLFAQRDTAPALPPAIQNPFHPDGFNAPDPEEIKLAKAEAARPISDNDLLAAIAEKIVPSGTASFKGETVLLIKGRKFRKSDHLAISFDGRDFDLEITDIQRTTFSLRYNRAEITRPIKSK